MKKRSSNSSPKKGNTTTLHNQQQKKNVINLTAIINNISEMFPEMDKSVVKELLEINDFDMEKTVSELFEVQNATQQAAQSNLKFKTQAEREQEDQDIEMARKLAAELALEEQSKKQTKKKEKKRKQQEERVKKDQEEKLKREEEDQEQEERDIELAKKLSFEFEQQNGSTHETTATPLIDEDSVSTIIVSDDNNNDEDPTSNNNVKSVNFIKEMFEGQIEDEVITSVLQENQGNIESTISILLSSLSDASISSVKFLDQENSLEDPSTDGHDNDSEASSASSDSSDELFPDTTTRNNHNNNKKSTSTRTRPVFCRDPEYKAKLETLTEMFPEKGFQELSDLLAQNEDDVQSCIEALIPSDHFSPKPISHSSSSFVSPTKPKSSKYKYVKPAELPPSTTKASFTTWNGLGHGKNPSSVVPISTSSTSSQYDNTNDTRRFIKDGTDLASRMKLDLIKKQYPTVSSDVIESIYSSSHYNMTITVSTLHELYSASSNSVPSPPPSPRKQNNSFINSTAANTTNTVEPNTVTPVAKQPSKKKAKKEEEEEQEWITVTKKKRKNKNKSGVATGGTTGNAQFEADLTFGEKTRGDIDWRRLANTHGSLRNHYFQGAAAAYGSGRVSSSSQLANKGKYHDLLMKEAHKRAMNKIVRREEGRNGTSGRVVDLHGLLVKEALSIVEQVVDGTDLKPREVVSFITGKGVHSAGGIARIKPAVEKMLKEKGIRFRDSGGVIVACI